MATLTRSIVAPPPPDPVCRCCGHHGHQCDSCPHLYQSDAKQHRQRLGRILPRPRLAATRTLAVRSKPRLARVRGAILDQHARPSLLRLQLFQFLLFQARSLRGSSPARRPASQNPQHHYQPGQPRCKSPPPLALASAPLLSPLPDDYLLVTILPFSCCTSCFLGGFSQ
jgi:hypothetical protein